jgi:HD-GYP domain-containing protein (c-di-GMP phosphodiesterase class II)
MTCMQPPDVSANLLLAASDTRIDMPPSRSRHETQRLASLRALSETIAGSGDRQAALQMILRMATTELRLDAAAILRLDRDKGVLVPVSHLFLAARTIHKRRAVVGARFGAQAALERRAVTLSDCTAPGVADLVRAFAATEGFRSWWALPLLAGERSVGVLELYAKRQRNLRVESRLFLEVLAGQAALALALDESEATRTQMATELRAAQDLAVQGWCCALELRDRETGAHSQRVANLTVAFSRALGVNETQLMHIHRGALLHDIGKIAVPDYILSKPGPLTAEEWKVIRRHPDDAFEVLYGSDLLRPAIDIPYCHHEHWDGSGYPRGIRGVNIPLAARIFSVVDVWDALGSKRPYGSVWSPAAIRAYLEHSAGTLFDPAVVAAFLRLDRSGYAVC